MPVGQKTNVGEAEGWNVARVGNSVGEREGAGVACVGAIVCGKPSNTRVDSIARMSAAQQPSAVTAAHCASPTWTAASFTASETTPLRPTAQAGTLMRVLQHRSRVNRPSQQEYPNGLRSVAQQASHGFWLSKHEGSFAQRNMVGALVAPAAVIAGFGELQQASAV